MDDITFCLSECKQTDCFRHPINIQDRTIPHSYADFKGTDTCPSRQLIEKMQLSKEDATKDATFDCISRQAALHYIADWQYGEANVGNETVYDNIEKFYKMIEQLPSAQPEIVRCKDCEHRDPEDKKCDCGHAILWQLPRRDDWYCADAERRTDG